MSDMIKTVEKLQDWIEETDRTYLESQPGFSIQFGMPDDNLATVHVKLLGKEVVVINCFRWPETRLLRQAMVFGGNQQSRVCTWLHFKTALEDIVQSKELYDAKVESK